MKRYGVSDRNSEKLKIFKKYIHEHGPYRPTYECGICIKSHSVCILSKRC